jgi:prefoldin subunit 5
MKKDHLEVLIDDVNDKLERLTEGMSLLQSDNREIKKTVADLPEIKADIKTIKAAVTDQSRKLRQHEHVIGDHENRLSGLEHAA